jgi:hypothetical protein
MTDTKHWDALRAAGDVQPPTLEALTRATAQLERTALHSDHAAPGLNSSAELPSRPTQVGASRAGTTRRRVLVIAASVAAVAGVSIGFAALQQPSGTPAAIPASTSTSTYPPSRPVGGTTATLCAVEYYPGDLVKRQVAFDGTVLSATRAPRTAFGWNVTLQVNEWFRPSTGKQRFTVLMWVGPGHRQRVSDMQGYEIGDRLLVSGGPRVLGGDPMDRPVSTACGFTRTYDIPTADTWRKVFSK